MLQRRYAVGRGSIVPEPTWPSEVETSQDLKINICGAEGLDDGDLAHLESLQVRWGGVIRDDGEVDSGAVTLYMGGARGRIR